MAKASQTIALPGEYVSVSLGTTPRWAPGSALDSTRIYTTTESIVTARAAAVSVTDKERQAVEQWLMQLLRKEIGPALAKVEAEKAKAQAPGATRGKAARGKVAPPTLRITVDAVSASIILEAMRRRSEGR